MSEAIEKAKNLISEVRGKMHSPEELGNMAIDLAKLMLDEAIRIETREEKKTQAQLAKMMKDPKGKVFTTAMTDQCFRSCNPKRIIDQLSYLMKRYGTPQYLSAYKRVGLKFLAIGGKIFPKFSATILQYILRQETQKVIVPGEAKELSQHIIKRQKENVRTNLNHLGEAILGENEAAKKLQTYIGDLKNPRIAYISVKISTIYSQISLLDYENSIATISERLRKLYSTAETHKHHNSNGQSSPKFVNLDMEEYKDLHMTVDAFCKVLSEEPFLKHSAGIVLQSYIPDSFTVQQKLTAWAIARESEGGAPIKIRIVKGANLAMEKVEASMRNWPQAPYDKKQDVDANYKKMVLFAAQPQNAQAVHIGIGSHNLFDIAFAMLVSSQNGVEKYFSFEMLEGMADHLRRVVQQVAGNILLYCPTATNEEFQNAVAYLVRRLDENSAPENFLHSLFNLHAGSTAWEKQAELFLAACKETYSVSTLPRRFQDRNILLDPPNEDSSFANEPDTDWSLKQNIEWAKNILSEWQKKQIDNIPLFIGGQSIYPQHFGIGIDPSYPEKKRYRYSLAGEKEVELAVETAKNAQQAWSEISQEQRSELLASVAENLRQQRANLIGSMVLDGGKTILEADVEISEAIDFAEYYRKNIFEWNGLKGISWAPKGTILVTPPWNFPCSIPAGGILAALITGNTVIFKPAKEAVLIGFEVAKAFWDAGISKEVLQFITCEDDPIGSKLIQDQRISAVILTGSTETAKLFLKMRPGIELMAETGGKNAIIVTSLADRDLAIKEIINSAFGHAGQKCSACSLAILDAEVYDDEHFLEHLKDAAESLHVGSPWDRKTKIPPLIAPPGKALQRGLTSLEPGETWLLEPKNNSSNPQEWSPGIKIDVQKGSFTHQTELFGPVLAVMRAKDLQEAIDLANSTHYGLTAGIQTLDEREKLLWEETIEAGNCYINRGITGAIVQRQPFGGCKESSFGRGFKAGGPNYLSQLMTPKEKKLPDDKATLSEGILKLEEHLIHLQEDEQKLWKLAANSYAFWQSHYFCKDHDPSQVLGEDNILRYKPCKIARYRITEQDRPIHIYMLIAASITTKCPLEISIPKDYSKNFELDENFAKKYNITFIIETNEAIVSRLSQRKDNSPLRMAHKPPHFLETQLSQAAIPIIIQPIFAHGRIELLNFLREVSISHDYHRYGNLGEREK